MKRKLFGIWLKVVLVLGFGTSLFHIYTGAFGTYTPLVQRGVHLGLITVMSFLLFSAGTKKSPVDRPSVVDIIFSVVTAFFTFYLVYNGTEVMGRMLFVTPLSIIQQILGLAIIVVILEAVRRTCGLTLVIVVLFFMAYAYLGAYLPGVFGHPGFSLMQMVDYLVWSDQGMFGLPLGVSATYVALFVILGGIMTKVGISDIFRDIAIMGSSRTVGGPAKIAVIFSGLLGMTTGSSAANVYGAGNFTIPLMKEKGYPADYAGGIEATASCGGQIMPPVMGAGAFVMAEFLGIPYAKIMLHAIIPAILYYTAVFASIHFLSLKLGMKRPEKMTYQEGLLKRLYMLAPLFVLVISLIAGFSSLLAAYYGIIAAFVVGALRILEGKLIKGSSSKLQPSALLEGMYLGGTWLISMGLACAAAGFVVGVLAMTGLGMAFIGVITSIAGNHLLPVAISVMVVCILLGMGIPTTTAYILAAAFAAPALVKLGIQPLVAHFFVFFFSVFANITPPVAVASYAAAQIAEADIMSTSYKAIKVGISALILPYLFLVSPSLLGLGSPFEIAVNFFTAVVGVIFLSSGLLGWFKKELSLPERVLLVFGGLLFMYPSIYVTAAGAAIVCAYMWYSYFFTGKDKDTANI